MRWRIPLVAVLALFVAVSCDQKLVEPAADEVASEATFDFMNNPDGGSLIVDRWESHWRACWLDSDNGLFVCHVTAPPGSGAPDACDIQEAIEPLSHQDIGEWLENEEFWDSFIHHVVKGDTWVFVGDANVPGDCFGGTLVASGWGKFMTIDNDVLGVGPELANANTWQSKGTGRLMTPGGEKVAYNGMTHYQVSSSHGFRVLKESVSVR